MEITKLFEFIQFQKDNFPLEKAYGYKKGDKWTYFSTDQVVEMANKVSCGLLEMGLQPGDKVAMVTYKTVQNG